jgi:hypothetical protein
MDAELAKEDQILRDDPTLPASPALLIGPLGDEQMVCREVWACPFKFAHLPLAAMSTSVRRTPHDRNEHASLRAGGTT